MTKKTKKSTAKSPAKRADLYDEGDFNYLHYWDGRDYEHQSEQIALKRLLRGKHFPRAVDIGGGYGRLCVFLKNYSDEVTLAEPSKKQLAIAKDFLKKHKGIKQKQMQADKLDFHTNTIDLVTMIRVMHHLPDPSKEFAEIARVLKKNGYLVLEVANYAHGRNRIRHLLQGKKLPTKPVDIRSPENKHEDEVPFVNHNPKTVIKQLAHAGLKVERTLSVSNLRSPAIKRFLPIWLMTFLERPLQIVLSKTYFGPSVFFFVRRVK